MTSSVDALVERVRQRFTYEGASAATPVAIAAAVRADPGAAVLGQATLRRAADRLTSEMAGAGPLTPLLADPEISDVLVNGVDVWVDRGRGLERRGVGFDSADDVRRLAQRLAASAGRRLDDACPYVDAQLIDGTRLHAVLPPVVQHPCLSLRTFRRRAYSLGELVSCGSVEMPAARLLASVVSARLPYLITGGTGAGKTTVLSALLSMVPANERIVIVEDAAELRPAHPHAVALQARTSNVEGAGSVTLRDLVRQALRMRPDRLVVGECRGGEVVDLLGAFNTGHEGGAATLHANAPGDVPARLEALGLLGGVPRAALHAQVAAGLRVVIHLRRGVAGLRLVEEICLLVPDGPDRTVIAKPAWHRVHGEGPAFDELNRLIAAAGAR